MFSKEEINEFCGRITLATHGMKTPAETVFPATEWNRKIGVLKSNLNRLQTMINNLISRPPTDKKVLTETLTLANKHLETQIFNVWLALAHNRGLTDSSYTTMFALVDEWRQRMSDQYWGQSSELEEMTARCARAEEKIAELIGGIAKSAEIKGRYKEKSHQMVRLQTQVTQAIEKTAMVQAEGALYVRTSTSILYDTTLTDAEKVNRLKLLTGQNPEFSQKKLPSNDELSDSETENSTPSYTPKYGRKR